MTRDVCASLIGTLKLLKVQRPNVPENAVVKKH